MNRQHLIVTAIGIALALPVGSVFAQQQGDAQMQQQQTGSRSQDAAGGKDIAAMTAGDLKGKQVVNAEGNDIGEVKHVARGPDDRGYAIVSVGGFWNIGSRDVAIPLNELQSQDDKLALTSDKSEDQLKQEASSRQISNYEVVDDDQSLASYVGGAAGGSQMSFQQLDADGDGYISSQEASGNPSLANKWQDADRNSDGRVDQSEFSAFETQMK